MESLPNFARSVRSRRKAILQLIVGIIRQGVTTIKPNSHSNFICHRCGKPGHIAPKSRQNKQLHTASFETDINSAKIQLLDQSSELKYDFVHMKRNQTNRLIQKDEVAGLDSGASVHVLSGSTLCNLGWVESEPTRMILQTDELLSTTKMTICSFATKWIKSLV